MLKRYQKKGFLKLQMPFAFLQTMIIVYLVLGSCRVGSLEIRDKSNDCHFNGSCRVGSLENQRSSVKMNYFGSCRVGSLEKMH